MKRCLLFVLLATMAGAVFSQNNLLLKLAPRLGTAPFQLDVPVDAGGYAYKITRLDYYISGISITHDGGQVTPLTDVYLLVHAAQDSLFNLGVYPGIVSVEGISFSLGVDPDHNHLDPTTYPPGHPLAPQDPAMHWGWSAGYRFLAIEGVAGTDFAHDFGIHALGDVNYKLVTLATSAVATADGLTIPLIADYARVLSDIDVSEGLIVHGSQFEAVTVMNNMRKQVFAAATSSTVAPAFGGTFAVTPNPATAGEAVLSMTLPGGYDYRLMLTDRMGRLLSEPVTSPGEQTLRIGQGLPGGVYFVQLWRNGRPVAIEKLVIVQ